MSLKDFVRGMTPGFMLDWNRDRKKKQRNQELEKMAESGQSITLSKLEEDFRNAGLKAGDIVLVHSSQSKIGHLEHGPKTFVDALMNVVTEEGTILMPTSPNAEYQLDYIQKYREFDVEKTPSKIGKITEYFRTLPGVKRSWHPTEPVSAWGANVDFFLSEHFGELTPYSSKSPFYKVSQKGGKILYVGVTLANAGTNLHTLEDAVDFKFPVYADQIFEMDIIDPTGKRHRVRTKVHNPELSKRRKCDELIPIFEREGVMTHAKIGHANTLVTDAKKMLVVMMKEYTRRGVTMYTPSGSK